MYNKGSRGSLQNVMVFDCCDVGCDGVGRYCERGTCMLQTLIGADNWRGTGGDKAACRSGSRACMRSHRDVGWKVHGCGMPRLELHE